MQAGLTVYLFSGIELLLGLLARSAREAQLMGMPVLIAGGAMVYAAQKSAEEAAKLIYPPAAGKPCSFNT